MGGWVCGGVGVWGGWVCGGGGCVGGVGVWRGWVCGGVCGCVGVWGWVCGDQQLPPLTQSPRLGEAHGKKKHMEKHVAAPSLENSGLNLTNSQLSSPPQAAVRTSTRCQSSLTSVQSEVLQHMAPGRKKSLSKLPAIKQSHLHSLVKKTHCFVCDCFAWLYS